jgi:uncharacterized protein YdaU (DUF1376 family)
VNYYSHHIGDYLTDTAHLSILEDGAYRRLMDRYYSTEMPISADESALFRVLRARSSDEQEAVRVVLQEFFVLTDAGWTHKRCDAEIEAFKAKSGKAAEAANKRWSKSSGADAMPTHSERNADAMLTKNQEPITKNQVDTPPAAKSPKPSKKNKTPLPADFAVSERVAKWAKEKGYGQLEAHLENFLSACRKSGYTYVDWDEAFMDAIRKDWAKLRVVGYQASAPPAPAPRPVLPVEQQVPSLAPMQRSGRPADFDSIKHALKTREVA